MKNEVEDVEEDKEKKGRQVEVDETQKNKNDLKVVVVAWCMRWGKRGINKSKRRIKKDRIFYRRIFINKHLLTNL